MEHNPTVVYSVNHRLDGGGMGTSVTEMLIGLHQAKLLKQAIVSSSRTTRLPANIITQQGILGRIQKRLALYDPSHWLANYLESWLFDRWTIRVMQPATIFSSWAGICLASLQVAKMRGMKTIVGLGSAHPRTTINLINKENAHWDQPLQTFNAHAQQIEKELVAADIILVQSKFSERSLIENGVSTPKIVRVPLGVDLTHFTPTPAPLPPEPFRVLFLGQIILRKGVQFLLQAWKQLNWSNAELWIVGRVSSEGRHVLATYSKLPGLKILGHVPDQAEIMRQSHVLVMPSVEDGFGLVLLEAMACGLPVIVSSNVGAADLVQHGESGFIVSYEDVNSYAKGLDELRSQPSLRESFRQAGKIIVQQQSWNNYRTQFVNLHK